MSGMGFQSRRTLRSKGEVTPRFIALFLAMAIAGVLVFFLLRGGRQRDDVPLDRQSPGAPAAPGAKAGQGAEDSKAEAIPAPAGSKEGDPAAKDAAPEGARPGGVLKGTVRVAGTDAPAPGIQVVARREEATKDDNDFQKRFQIPKAAEGDLTGLAGADGRYRIEGLAPWDYKVFALRADTDFVSILPSQGRTVTIGPALGEEEMDIEVAAGGVISGSISDPEGSPLADVRVSTAVTDFLSSIFDQDAGFQGIEEAKTKEDGTFRFRGLLLEKKYLVIAEPQGRTRVLSEELAFPEGEREIVVELVSMPGASVSGKVVDERGEPLQGIQVSATSAEAKSSILLMEPPRVKTTEADGVFEFTGLSPAKYTISADQGGKQVTKAIECDGMTAIADIVLALLATPAPVGAVLSGKVVDPEGGPLQGAQLDLVGFVIDKGPHQGHTTSQADGTFRFENVPQGGMYTLNVKLDGRAPHTMSGVSPGGEPIEVVLQKMARVRGIVIARAGGAPVANAAVRVMPVLEGIEQITQALSGQMAGGAPKVATAADGTFTIENVTPCRARIRADASKFAPGLSKEVEILSGADLEGVKVELSDGGTIAGTVVGPDGKAIDDATIRAMEVSGDPIGVSMRKMMSGILASDRQPTARTENGGAFRLRHLAEGKYILLANHPEFGPSAELDVLLGPDEVRQGLRVKLSAPATLRVLTREKEKPLPGLTVQVVGTGPLKMLTTDADGRAEILNLGPGDYMVQVMDLAKMMSGQGMAMRQKVITLTEGQTADLEFAFGVGAKVTGKVAGPRGGPIGMVVVKKPDAPRAEDIDMKDFGATIRAAGYNVGWSMISQDGTFSITDLPDGEFIFEVPRVPADYMKAAQMKPEERKPYLEKAIRISGGRDLDLGTIRIQDAAGGGAPTPALQGDSPDTER